MARLGACQICQTEEARYKCAKCVVPYCTLVCYKAHECEPKDTRPVGEPVAQLAEQSSDPLDQTTVFERIFQDKTMQEYLSYPSLKIHLSSVYSLLTDPAASGEVTREGRQDVALKKLRHLRAGGKEENELVEMFVDRFVELQEKYKQ